MGRGPSINELAEQNEAFQAYLAELRDTMKKDLSVDTAALELEVSKYYAKGGWKYQPLMQADQFDVQQISTWSLDNVVKILNGVRDAIFGDTEPPDGIVIEKPSSILQSMKDLENLNLLAANRAFALIQGVLETFATQTSYRGKAITNLDLVAPGMTLFISIRSDVYRNKGWFNNEYIGQYMYVMRSFFSLEQAGDLSKYNDLLAYEELKASYRTRMRAVAAKIADPNTPFDALQQLEVQLGHYADEMASIQAKIEALTKDETQAHLESARLAIAQRRAATSLRS